MKKAVLIALAFFVCFAIFMHAIGQGSALKDTSLTGKDGVGVKVIGFFATIGSSASKLVEDVIDWLSFDGGPVADIDVSALSPSYTYVKASFEYSGKEYFCYFYHTDFNASKSDVFFYGTAFYLNIPNAKSVYHDRSTLSPCLVFCSSVDYNAKNAVLNVPRTLVDIELVTYSDVLKLFD